MYPRARSQQDLDRNWPSVSAHKTDEHQCVETQVHFHTLDLCELILPSRTHSSSECSRLVLKTKESSKVCSTDSDAKSTIEGRRGKERDNIPRYIS